jgi:transcription initiation factor TFIID subunit 9B
MDHVGREELELEDVRLAIQSQVNHTFTEPPSVEYLLELGSQKNANNFNLPEKTRVLLPPAQHCLTAPNYQLDVKKKRQRLNEEEPQPIEQENSNTEDEQLQD